MNPPTVAESAANANPASAGSLWKTARIYRRKFRHFDFKEVQVRILDVILFYSLERDRFEAFIPADSILAKLCRLDGGDVSRHLKYLEGAKVIERVQKGFALLDPAGWRVPDRLTISQDLREIEEWLEIADPDQPELIPEPPGLDAALRKVFVEQVASSQVESGQVSVEIESVPQSNGPGRGSAVSIERAAPDSQVGYEPTIQGDSGVQETCLASGVQPGAGQGDLLNKQVGEVGKLPSPTKTVGKLPSRGPKVGNLPTPPAPHITRARFDPDRLIDSRKNCTRFDLDRDQSGQVGKSPTFRDEVAGRLWRRIGEHEQLGPSGPMWRMAIQSIPDQLNELLGAIDDMERCGQPRRNPSGWLNSSARNELRIQGILP